jgi:cyclophilin family peptidyl-prolyl cis-trans isomerase
MKSIAASLVFCITLSGAPIPALAQGNTPTDYPQVEMETTAGNFTVELFTERAPITVENFLRYVDDGFYDGVIFHRVVADFVVQAGGYDKDYKKKAAWPTIPNESGNGLSNRRGFVAMARTGNPHSADSQFYINLGDNLALDPRPTRWGYTVFGRVIEGMDAVDQIGYSATGPGPVPNLTKDVPAEPVVITSVRLIGPAATDDVSAKPAE